MRVQAANVDVWGGGLDEVMVQRVRTRPSVHEYNPAPPRAGAPAPARAPPSVRVQAANVDVWGGGLDEVMVQRVRTRPPVQEYNPAPPRAAASRAAAATDEWGGDLGEVMQQQRPRARLRFADVDCDDDQQQHQTHHHQPTPPPPALSALVSMGFDPAAARAALHRHRTVDAAVEALAPEAAVALQPPSPVEPPSGAAAFEAVSRRPHRGPVVTVEEWGGGLGDVLRPPAPPRRSQPAAHAAAPQDQATQPPRYSHAHASNLPPHGSGGGSGGGSGSRGSRGSAAPPVDEYYDLMQMHMRDNVDSSKKLWQEDWRAVLKLFKSVKPPSRTRTQRPPPAAASDGAPAAEEEAECCSICIEPLHATCVHLKGPSHGPATAVCSLPCGHAFHRKCLTECVKRGHWTCPNCRDDLRKRL